MLENNARFETGEKSLQYANKTIKSTNVNTLYKEKRKQFRTCHLLHTRRRVMRLSGQNPGAFYSVCWVGKG